MNVANTRSGMPEDKLKELQEEVRAGRRGCVMGDGCARCMKDACWLWRDTAAWEECAARGSRP